LSGLLRLIVGGHETFAQCFADRRQRAVLRQQQGNLVQGWLASSLSLVSGNGS
jgi:hypothetical protein